MYVPRMSDSGNLDAIVIGSGPNGLSAAIELARNGRSVLVIEGADTIGGSARSADLTLPALAQPHGDTPNSNVGPVFAVGASPASILDRFAEVEGLSGSRFADILRGDNVDAVEAIHAMHQRLKVHHGIVVDFQAEVV